MGHVWHAVLINWRTDGDKFRRERATSNLLQLQARQLASTKEPSMPGIRSPQARQLASTKEPSMPVFFRISLAGFTCESPTKDTSDQARAPRNDRGCSAYKLEVRIVK